MALIQLNSENFEKVIFSNPLVLCDFWAPWCGPCRMVGPVIEELAEELTDVTVCKLNVDESPEIAQKLGIMSIPTVIVFRDGEVSSRTVGVRSKEEYVKLVREN